MLISELIEKTGWKPVTKNVDLNTEITGVYCGDLLSWVMGNGEPGQAWITVQVHMNIIAVSKLREFSCILIADGANLPEEIAERAEEEEIAVIETGIPVFETAKKMIEAGV
ncbi:MAG: hypothetical protein IJJ29_00375 [Solobacterium sp.]|nr:hypothetical protein [Solobacterium sp.]